MSDISEILESVQADYAERGKELRQRFAIFGRKALDDHHHSILSLAASVLPENHIGDKLWLTMVSGTDVYADSLKDWAREFCHAICTSKPLRKSGRPYPVVSSYDRSWGDWAALDALVIATGFGRRVAAYERARTLGCKRKSYTKARNLVAGALLIQASQFEWELGWSWRVHCLEDEK